MNKVMDPAAKNQRSRPDPDPHPCCHQHHRQLSSYLSIFVLRVEEHLLQQQQK